MLFKTTIWKTLVVAMLLVLFQNFTLAQVTVQGYVSDETQNPLIGVSVIVEGSSTGTVTNVDGNFTIEVPSAESVLRFSYIGYQTQRITVGNQTTMNVVLTEGANELNEIVVIGYGTQEKEDVTGAISSVNGSDFQNLPAIGASQLLQGRAAGVNIVRNGGAPGAGGSIRIRGTGTVNNADPLIVIDGVPVANANINDINPNDIESIEILKDASASAIYGQRAANGVVIVTTKRGSFNEAISVDLNAYWGVSNSVNTIDVLDASTLAEVKREAFTNDGLDIPEVWTDPTFQTNRTNWQDELLGTGNIQNYDFTVRGGGEKSAFSLSGGYFEEQGMMDKSFYERYYLRINSDHKITDWLKIGQNLQLTRQRQNELNTNSAQSGILWSAIRFHPSLPVIVQPGDNIPGHEVGDYGSSSLVPGGGQFGDINNPIFTADIEDQERTGHRVLGNVFAEVEILEGLKLRGNFALDGEIWDRDRFEVVIDRQIRARSQNSLLRQYRERYSLLGEYFLTYDKVFSNVHSINFVAGYTAQQFVTETVQAERTEFPNEDAAQRFLDAGNTIDGAAGGKTEDALVSGFARLNYSYDDKYYLSATFRADGSSKFADGNKWGYFPAFSAGWRVSREPFLANNKLISFLKVSAGWGQLGNQNVPGLQYLALIASGRRYSFGGEQIVGSSQSRFPNANISWETAELLNFGLDIGFFENRLLANFNYFIKDTKDMLLAPPTVGTIGRTNVPDQNVGELRNQGLEVEISYRNKVGDFTYNIGANASFIENEVTKLFNGNFLATDTYGRPNEETVRTFEGSPIGTFFGWTTDGLYNSESEINSDANIANDPRREEGLIQPGDVRFVDLNNDGVIDEQDRTILGDPFPAITYGLNAGIGYKGFDLNLFFLGVGGTDIYNADRMQGLDASYPFNLYADAANRWTSSNTNTNVPRATTRRDNRNFRTSDLFIEDGSFFRLKNLTLGYTFPSTMTENWGMRNLRIYLTGQNVFTITDYSGLDPELGYNDVNSQRQQQNVDYAQYPQARTWTFGLSVGF